MTAFWTAVISVGGAAAITGIVIAFVGCARAIWYYVTTGQFIQKEHK